MSRKRKERERWQRIIFRARAKGGRKAGASEYRKFPSILARGPDRSEKRRIRLWRCRSTRVCAIMRKMILLSAADFPISYNVALLTWAASGKWAEKTSWRWKKSWIKPSTETSAKSRNDEITAVIPQRDPRTVFCTIRTHPPLSLSLCLTLFLSDVERRSDIDNISLPPTDTLCHRHPWIIRGSLAIKKGGITPKAFYWNGEILHVSSRMEDRYCRPIRENVLETRALENKTRFYYSSYKLQTMLA